MAPTPSTRAELEALIDRIDSVLGRTDEAHPGVIGPVALDPGAIRSVEVEPVVVGPGRVALDAAGQADRARLAGYRSELAAELDALGSALATPVEAE